MAAMALADAMTFAEGSNVVRPSVSEDLRESTHWLAQRLQQMLAPLRWRSQGRRRR
jgi:hypothetical protein